MTCHSKVTLNFNPHLSVDLPPSFVPSPSPFLLGVLCSRSSRILFSRSRWASLLPRAGWCSGDEVEDDGTSSNSPILSAERSSSPLRSSASCPSSSSSSSPVSLSRSGLLGLASAESSEAMSMSSSTPLPSSPSGGKSSPRSQEEASSSQPPASLGRSLFQADRPPFLL